MSSLWTPGGEHRVPRGDQAAGPGGGGAAAGGGAPANGHGGGEPGPAPEADDDTLGRAEAEVLRQEVAAEIADIERQLLAAPVEDVIANHCYGFFQLAALHLSERPPDLDSARLAIDGLGAVVEALGPRLGEHEQSLRDGLAQLRLAFVQIAKAAAEETAPPGAPAGEGARPAPAG